MKLLFTYEKITVNDNINLRDDLMTINICHCTINQFNQYFRTAKNLIILQDNESINLIKYRFTQLLKGSDK